MNDAFSQPQSVLVLGGTSDIGLAIVKDLIERRCRHVILAGRDETRLADQAEKLRGLGASVDTVTMEATNTASAAGVVNGCFDQAGSIDLILVAVGLLGDQNVADHDPDAVSELMTVNLTWPAAAMTAAANRLRSQGYGKIVVLSSVAGIRVRRANYAYGATKAGLDGFTLGLAESLHGSGVSVLCVRPGFVITKMTEGRPKAPFSTTPEAVAEAVMNALTRGDTVVWVPSVLRYVFSVFRLLPQSIWRRLPG